MADTKADVPPQVPPDVAIKPPTANDEGKLPTMIDHKQVRFGMYKGTGMAYLYEPLHVQVQKVKSLKLRDDDVLLCSFPRSGTHWTWRVLDMLLSGSAEYSDRFPDFTMLDFQSIELMNNLPSPRVLLTHYPFELLPEQLKQGNTKMVHVHRHPKAVLTSLYLLLKKNPIRADMTLQQFFDQSFSGKVAAQAGGQFAFFDSLKEYEKQNPNINMFHVSYEDMKKDTTSCVRKLADYLGVGVTDELCSKIAQAVSFDNQKKGETGQKEERSSQDIHYRKGETDDWKNYLTVAQSEKLDAIIRDRADTCRFSRLYAPST